MSTKTTFKRVALVAAVAAAFGGLSTVAANATAGTAPTLSGAGSAAGANTTATPVVGNYVAESITAGTADSYYTITTSGVGSVLYPASLSGTTLTAQSATSEIWSDGYGSIGAQAHSAAQGASWGSPALTFSIYSATAGTQTITFTGSTSAAQTMTITWGAAAVPSAANSVIVVSNTADIRAANGGSVQESTSDTLTPVVKTVLATADNTTAGVGIYVNLKNNATSSVTYTADQISASVSGPGLLKIGSASASTASGLVTAANAASAGRSVVAAANGFALVYVYADGTAGTSTVTISDATAGITLGTVSVTFYSRTIAKLV
jgi:hypothetical protein